MKSFKSISSKSILISLTLIAVFVFACWWFWDEHEHGTPEYEISLRRPEQLEHLLRVMTFFERNKKPEEGTRTTPEEIKILSRFIFLQLPDDEDEGIRLTDLLRLSTAGEKETASKGNFNKLYLMADQPFEKFLSEVEKDTSLEEIEAALTQCRDRRRAEYFRKSIETDKVRSVFRLTGVKGPLINKAEQTECLECMHIWIDDLVKDERKTRILPVVQRYRALDDVDLKSVAMPSLHSALSLRRLPWPEDGKDRRMGRFDAKVIASVPLSSKAHEATLDSGIWYKGLQCSLPSTENAELIDEKNLPPLKVEESQSSLSISPRVFTKFLHTLSMPVSAVITKVKTERFQSGFRVSFGVSHRELPAKLLFESTIRLDGDTLSRGSANALHREVQKMRRQFFQLAREKTIPALQEMNGFALSDIRPSPITGSPAGLFQATIHLGGGVQGNAFLFLDETKGGEVVLQPKFDHRVRREILMSLLRSDGLEKLGSRSKLEKQIFINEEGFLRGEIEIKGVDYDWGFSDESQRIYWINTEELKKVRNLSTEIAGPLGEAGEDATQRVRKILRKHKLGEAMRLEELELSPEGSRISLSLKIADWPELLVEGLGGFGFDDSDSLRQLEEFLSEENLKEELEEAASRRWSRNFEHPRYGKVTAVLKSIVIGDSAEIKFEVDLKSDGKMKDMLELTDVCLRINQDGWEVLNEVDTQALIKSHIEEGQFLSDSMNALLAPFELFGSIELDDDAFGKGKWLRLSPLRIAAKVEIFIPGTSNRVKTNGTLSFEDGWSWANRRLELNLGQVKLYEEVSLAGAKAALDFERRKVELDVSMKLSDDGLNIGNMKLSTTWGEGKKLDFESYSFEGTLAMLGEGELGYLAGTFQDKNDERNFGFAAEATSAEFSLDEFFSMSGDVAYRHREKLKAGADFSMGLMSGGGGDLGLKFDEDEADPDKKVEVEKINADLQARFPIGSILPGTIRVSGEAGKLNEQAFSFSSVLDQLELYGEASINFLAMACKLRVWANADGLKDWDVVVETPQGPIVLDLGRGDIVESMDGDELEDKLERMLLDKLDKVKVDDAIRDSHNARDSKSLLEEHFENQDGAYRLKDGLSKEEMDEVVETFEKENQRLLTQGKALAFAPQFQELSEEELAINKELPEAKFEPGQLPSDYDWNSEITSGNDSGFAGKPTQRSSKPISNVVRLVVGCTNCQRTKREGQCLEEGFGSKEVRYVSRDDRITRPYARFNIRQLDLEDGHHLNGFQLYSDGPKTVLYGFDDRTQNIKGAVFRTEDATFLKEFEIISTRDNLESKLKSSLSSNNFSAVNVYLFSIIQFNRLKSSQLAKECKILQRGTAIYPMVAIGPDENESSRILLAHRQTDLNKDFVTSIDFSKLENSKVLYDVLQAINPLGNRIRLLHLADSEKSGMAADESYLHLHGSKLGTKRFSAKSQTYPSPENSRVLYSYLASLEPSNDLKTIGVSQDGFCVRRGEGEEEFLHICSFAEANAQTGIQPWFKVSLRSFQKNLSNREDLLRLLPSELKSELKRGEAMKDSEFPLVIVEQAEWKKRGWKANPMGILRSLIRGN